MQQLLRGDKVDLEIEHIAQAFFAAWHSAETWENASRSLKHEFRLYARHAISMMEKRQEQMQQLELPPVVALEAA